MLGSPIVFPSASGNVRAVPGQPRTHCFHRNQIRNRQFSSRSNRMAWLHRPDGVSGRGNPRSVHFSPSTEPFQPVQEILDLAFDVCQILLDNGVGVAFSNGARGVCRDMWQRYTDMVKEHLPGATLTFDKFHFAQDLLMAIDEARRKWLTWVAALQQLPRKRSRGGSQSHSASCPGRPKSWPASPMGRRATPRPSRSRWARNAPRSRSLSQSSRGHLE